MRIASYKSVRQAACRAFTMIEIAISLAIIGFALVAIVGLLPQGLNVQKDNREDTIISQDGAYYLEAIRGGVQGLDILTNYVDRIIITNIPPMGAIRVSNYTRANGYLLTGDDIVRLLTTRKYEEATAPNGTIRTNKYFVCAYARALSGPAIEQGRFADTNLIPFQYQMRAEVTRFAGGIDPESTNYLGTGYSQAIDKVLTQEEIIERSNRWNQVTYLKDNTYEVRLRIGWPVLPNGSVGPKWQVFRTLVSARPGTNSGIFEPQKYIFE